MPIDFTNIEAYIESLKASGRIKPEAYESTNLNDGPLYGINCPECGNTGQISFERDVYQFAKPCKCLKARQSLMKLRKSGLGDLIEEYTFKNYDTSDERCKRIKELAMRYAQSDAKNWFYISGTPGSGKTHICTAICSAMLKKGMSVKYVLWRDISQKLKSVINDAEYEDVLEDLKRPEILYIDDFMKGTVTEADVNRAFEIINARYNSPRKRTIISSERDLSYIRALDEAVGGRIWQRSKGFCLKAPDINWRN